MTIINNGYSVHYALFGPLFVHFILFISFLLCHPCPSREGRPSPRRCGGPWSAESAKRESSPRVAAARRAESKSGQVGVAVSLGKPPALESMTGVELGDEFRVKGCTLL